MVVGDYAIELDTVVIGSGPGGYVAAIRAAELGQDVTVIERDKIGGVCLNVGCVPSKALIEAGHRYRAILDSDKFGLYTDDVDIDFPKLQAWKEEQVVKRLTGGVKSLFKKHGIKVIRGQANFTNTNTLRVVNGDKDQTYSFNNAIIATGSSPVVLKGFEYGQRILDSTGALNLEEIPESMIVIGGGYIGTELAGVYANFGTKVTIIEAEDLILNQFDYDMSKLVYKNLSRTKHVDVVTNAFAKSATQDEDEVELKYIKDGKEETITADYLLVVVGRKPNTKDLGLAIAGVETNEKGLIKVDKQGRTTQKHIYAIGDVVPGPALAHKASYEGKVAAAAISGKKSAVDYLALPLVAFSDPDLATVGLSKREAENQGIKTKVSQFPMAANSRAVILGKTTGFVRIITEAETGLVLGGQVAGLHASDLIAEIALAVECRLNIEDIALTIHTHPTLSEATQEAADIALGFPTNI